LLVDALRASYIFASTLKKDDWVAVVDYDMKPRYWLILLRTKTQSCRG